jgi:hypothetical protein
MAGDALKYVLPKTAGEALMEFGMPAGFTLMGAAMAPGDLGDKAKVAAEQGVINMLPSFFGRGIGAAGALGMGAKNRLRMSPEEFNAHVLGRAQIGGMVADMSSMVMPMPITNSVYMKDAQQKQMEAAQQQLMTQPVAPTQQEDPRLAVMRSSTQDLEEEDDDPYRQHLMNLVMQGAYV